MNVSEVEETEINTIEADEVSESIDTVPETETAIQEENDTKDVAVMNFDFSDDQKLLRDQARKFLFDKCDRKSVRTVLDDDQLHYHKELWSQISEMGWTGTAIQNMVDLVSVCWNYAS